MVKHLLLKARKDNLKFIVLSIGIDGEKCDSIFETNKPDIFLEKGDMVITTEEAINNSSASFEIISVFKNDRYNKKERP